MLVALEDDNLDSLGCLSDPAVNRFEVLFGGYRRFNFDGRDQTSRSKGRTPYNSAFTYRLGDSCDPFHFCAWHNKLATCCVDLFHDSL